MNYLAHALLAEPHRYSIVGNIAGDLVKGRLADHRLHPRVADGIRRHRRVDALTDAHPRYVALKALFPREERRVAPIVLDVLFDHYLTQHWSGVADLDRDAFIDDVYATLTAPGQPLPDSLAAVAPRWVAADWLRVYESRDGVAAVIDRLAMRASRPLPLRSALRTAGRYDDALRAAFHDVFRDVRARLDGIVPRPASARGDTVGVLHAARPPRHHDHGR